MTKICEICGGGGADKTGFGTGLSALWYHSNKADCRRHLLTRAETAEAELANYKQWHEQEQIRAVDAEHQWGELVGELIPALGLPCGDNAGEVILAAVAALRARAMKAEAERAVAQIDHGLQIAVLDRGFVYIGRVVTDSEWCYIENAWNIRRWGTTRGLGELVDGPTSDTQLDRVGSVRVPFHVLHHLIAVKGTGWTSKLD
jgi:hypothetical protein